MCKQCKNEKKANQKKTNLAMFQNNDLDLKLIEGEVYADANSITDSVTLNNWRRSANTERYIKALSSSVNFTEDKLIITNQGSHDGTWIHEKLILSLARYISVDFEIWCDKKIAEFISKGNIAPMLPKSYKEALIELLVKVEENEKLQLENLSMKPKAEFYDVVANSEDTIDMSELAKITNKGYGRNKLFKLLREKNILRSNNEPYQKYIDAGYFKVIETSVKMGSEIKIMPKTLVYQKGVEYVINLIEQKG